MTQFVTDALEAIGKFLDKYETLVWNLDEQVQPYSIYECYSFVLVVEAYQRCHFRSERKGPHLARFKTSTKGNPQGFTYFVLRGLGETYEARLNQDCVNIDQNCFNLDITISHGTGHLDARKRLSYTDLATFCECKHYPDFSPSVCAEFMGKAAIVMFGAGQWPVFRMMVSTGSPPPALLVRGHASDDAVKMIRLVIFHGVPLRFLGSISPRGGAEDKLTMWVSGYL